MPTFPHIQTVVDKLCIEYIEEILYITVYGGMQSAQKLYPASEVHLAMQLRIGDPPGDPALVAKRKLQTAAYYIIKIVPRHLN